MPALHRAVALEEVHDPAVIVGEHLHLDVSRFLDEPLDVERAVAERGGGFAPRRLDRLVDLAGVAHAAHPLAAAAGRRLDERGQPDTFNRLSHPAIGLIVRRLARHDRHAGGGGEPPRVDLRSHLRDDRRGRADEREPGAGAGFGERGVLGQESVTRMDRVGAGARAASISRGIDR